MSVDLVVRNGTIVTGASESAMSGDIAIHGGEIVEIGPSLDVAGTREIDANDRLVTPGFIDIHTHLDAQIAWDPAATPTAWHGVTSAVMGNCGITFAPCRPGDGASLAELMESVEDIPRAAILESLPWNWECFGGYLDAIRQLPKSINVGGMVGHVAIRRYVMGDRAIDETPPSADEVAAIATAVDQAMSAGALGFSTSRTLMHRVADGRAVPGTWAQTDELLAIADALGRHRRGVFASAARLGERDSDDLTNTRAEVAWMGEVSRRAGRPVTFGLAQSDRRPDLYRQVLGFAHAENARGAQMRPQTLARGIAMLFCLESRSPFDRCPAWRELQTFINGRKLIALRDPSFRQRLIEEADHHAPVVDLARLYVPPPHGPARYDFEPADSLAAHASARGISAAAAYIELLIESDGRLVAVYPVLNQQLDAVAELLDDPLVAIGLGDAGAHVGQLLDASQPTHLLSYWVRDRQRWSIENAIRRLTSDPADLFGITDRGRIAVGMRADLNVIDLDRLGLSQPEFVRDLPDGSGRFTQRATGYDFTIVNGEVTMESGEPTGARPGQML